MSEVNTLTCVLALAQRLSPLLAQNVAFTCDTTALGSCGGAVKVPICLLIWILVLQKRRYHHLMIQGWSFPICS